METMTAAQYRAGLAVARERATKMTGPERAMQKHLSQSLAAGAIRSFRYEGMKLLIGGDPGAEGPKTWYTPDFMVVQNDGSITLIEVKAAWKVKGTNGYRLGFEGDARTKLRIAAGQWPIFRFVAMAPLKTGAWLSEAIS